MNSKQEWDEHFLYSWWQATSSGMNVAVLVDNIIDLQTILLTYCYVAEAYVCDSGRTNVSFVF